MTDTQKLIDLIGDKTLPYNTPLRDKVSGLLKDQTFVHGKFCTFAVDRNAGIDTKQIRNHDSGEYDITDVEIRIYGNFTWKEQTDNTAYVMLRYWFHTGTTQCYTHAQWWNGAGFKDMPDGARKAIAAKVQEAMFLAPSEWQQLARQDLHANKVAEINACVRRSMSELSAAQDKAKTLGIDL